MDIHYLKPVFIFIVFAEIFYNLLAFYIFIIMTKNDYMNL